MKTKITNVAPTARHYGFLPPHGMTLAKDQVVTFDGDLRTILAGGMNRFSRKTEISGLDAAINGLDLEYEQVADVQSSSSSSSSAP
jgi:hypothetical protein